MVKQLAIRNLKRSIQDYRIYLFTFTFSITIVYLFQSLVNQQTSIALSQNQLGLMNTILRALEGVNIFVVIAFSALLAGANGFLLKRRQQEFAIYYALGMKQHQVAQLLALETFGTGVIALILGIILGVAISQIMILMTAQLFQTTVINYQFLFSWIAILKTSVYFLIIIIGIFLLNYWQLKRYRITSLLKNKQKTYELKRVLQQRLVLEWSGATLLILSGYFFLQSTWFSKYFFVSIIVSLCMILTCIWLNITSVKLVFQLLIRSKYHYLKQLRFVTIRTSWQQINEHLWSIVGMSLLIVSAWSILTLSFSYRHTSEAVIQTIAPYDATIVFHSYESDKVASPVDLLLEKGVDVKALGDITMTNIYTTETTLNDLLAEYNMANASLYTFFDHGAPSFLRVITYDDYVNIAQLLGIEPIRTRGHEVLFLTNMDDMLPVFEDYLQTHETIDIDGQRYGIREDGYIKLGIENEDFSRQMLIAVVPEREAKWPQYTTVLNVMYDQKKSMQAEQLLDEMYQTLINFDEKQNQYDTQYGSFSVLTKQHVSEQVIGETALVVYIGMYSSIIILLACATLLSLHQLTFVIERKSEYQTLLDIGSSKKQMYQQLKKQMIVYFIVPVLLAFPQVLAILWLMVKLALEIEAGSTMISLAVSTGIIILIIGGYCIVSIQSGWRMFMKQK